MLNKDKVKRGTSLARVAGRGYTSFVVACDVIFARFYQKGQSMTSDSLRPTPPLFLREWRRFKALTQTELAERAGVTQNTVSFLEKPGQHRQAQPSTIRKLADALGIKPEQLYWPPVASAEAMGQSR